MPKNVLETIKLLLKTENVKGSHISKRIGHSEQSLRNMVRGETEMTLQVAENILSSLGYSIFICKVENFIEIPPKKIQLERLIEKMPITQKVDINKILAGTITKNK